MVTPDRLLRNSKLLHPTNCVSLYSRHRTEHSLRETEAQKKKSNTYSRSGVQVRGNRRNSGFRPRMVFIVVALVIATGAPFKGRRIKA